MKLWFKVNPKEVSGNLEIDAEKMLDRGLEHKENQPPKEPKKNKFQIKKQEERMDSVLEVELAKQKLELEREAQRLQLEFEKEQAKIEQETLEHRYEIEKKEKMDKVIRIMLIIAISIILCLIVTIFSPK